MQTKEIYLWRDMGDLTPDSPLHVLCLQLARGRRPRGWRDWWRVATQRHGWRDLFYLARGLGWTDVAAHGGLKIPVGQELVLRKTERGVSITVRPQSNLEQ
jgi:hypothetical protein